MFFLNIVSSRFSNEVNIINYNKIIKKWIDDGADGGEDFFIILNNLQ